MTRRSPILRPFEAERRALWVHAHAPRLRSMREFAEAEIVLPSGPMVGQKYRCKHQPYSGLWFDAIGSRLFNKFVATGPSQSGKTLTCSVIPTLYHLFEIRETVIFFAPNMEINQNKWIVDLRPAIECGPFAQFLPKSGRGSSGGFNELIVFRNGSMIKFMTGGGGDKNKAAFTARVAVGTEIDGMDTASEMSRETDPLGQIAARLRSHGSRAIEYHECTVSLPTGRIWREVKEGTDSRIAIQCQHCFEYVTPEREDFIGYEDVATELEAELASRFYCPACGAGWSHDERIAANRNAMLVHKGQVIKGGLVTGNMPETRTFGFRWSAVNNMFAEESQLGLEEWKAARNPDRESAEKERCQFVWAIPFTGETNGIDLDEKMVAGRLTGIQQFVCPDETETLVCQVDVHNRWHYWAVMATVNGAHSFVDYGITLTPFAGEETPEAAIRAGLESVKHELKQKQFLRANGEEIEIDLHVVDGGYNQDVVLEFITAANAENPSAIPKWIMSKGEGDDYTQPPKETPDKRPGNHFYQSRQPAKEQSGNQKWWLTIVDKNYFARRLHGGFSAETFESDGIRRIGSVALFGDERLTHLTVIDRKVARSAFATQVVAKKWGEIIVPGKSVRMGWVMNWKEDHFLDVGYGCLAADQILRYLRSRESKPKGITLEDWFNG